MNWDFLLVLVKRFKKHLMKHEATMNEFLIPGLFYFFFFLRYFYDLTDQKIYHMEEASKTLRSRDKYRG